MKKGFSLIELLISLIVISTILASFAPVVTNKLKHGGISLTSSKKLTMTCPATVGSECTLCLSNQCINCPIACGNKFKNILTCKCEDCNISNCIDCSSSGANSCDICADGYQKVGNNCIACAAGYYSTGGKACQKCQKGTKANAVIAATNCVSCSLNQYQDLEGQTSCKTCGTNKKPNSNHTDCIDACQTTSDCKDNEYLKDNCKCTNCPMHELALSTRTGCYDPCSSLGNAKLVYQKVSGVEYKFCMKAYNAGDTGGPAIPDLSGVQYGECLKVKDPWPDTADYISYGSCTTDMSSVLSDKTYEPCNRTVCTWHAADAICKAIGWKLPTRNHMEALRQYSWWREGYDHKEGPFVALNLCYTSFYGVNVSKLARCDGGSRYIKASGGSTNRDAYTRYPAAIWESENGVYSNLDQTYGYYGEIRTNGYDIDISSFNTYIGSNLNNIVHHHSVRCILDI